jgi:transposase
MPVETECPCCGGALHCIDEDVASRPGVIPIQYRVIVTVRPKVACRICSNGVFQAPAPKPVVAGGLPTEALIADRIVRDMPTMVRFIGRYRYCAQGRRDRSRYDVQLVGT